MTVATKQNHRQLLKQLADKNISGCLEVNSQKVSWKIYLDLGKLCYVHCSVQSLEQLKYYLHSNGCQKAILALNQLPESLLNKQDLRKDKVAEGIYGKVIPWLISQQQLDDNQIIQLIQSISQDNLFYCLCLVNGTTSWQQDNCFPEWISARIKSSLGLNLSKCLSQAESKQRQWQDCSPKISSIYQRPYFSPSWEVQPLPASGSLDSKTLTQLTQVLKGRTSIQQLSILLKKNKLLVAKILSPYIENKIICLNNAQPPLYKLPAIPRNSERFSFKSSVNNSDQGTTPANSGDSSSKTYKIVCIDDSPTILSEIKRFLTPEKFEITTIENPIQAAPKIFKINPDLILLDITMPTINGYKLCSLLRSSGKCDQIPIIMVTGNTGLIDKTRARISGASDYFTKPFTKDGLNKIVNKYLP